MRNPKAPPTTAIVPRLPVVTFELRGSRHRREARCKRLAGLLHGGSRSIARTRRCLRSGEAPGYRSSSRAGASDVALQARFGIRRFAGAAASCVSTTAPDLASLEACRESLPGPPRCIAVAYAVVMLRRRGLSSQDSLSRMAEWLSCAGPVRLRAKSLSRVPPVSSSSIAGRSECGGSRCLSGFTSSRPRLAPQMGCDETGPSRPVTPSQT
jgi:hypothetical protein